MISKELFKNKYRIKSTRLPYWDYSWPGYYYITINIKDNVKHFGDIINGCMYYFPIGIIAKKYWQDILRHFKNIGLDEYNIMPNHVHGIIVIYETKMNWVPNNVETQHAVSLRPKRKFSTMIPNSLSSMIRSYKSAVTNWCHKNGYPNFRWQPKFHDHIIRDDYDLNEIREYIWDNPRRWSARNA